MSIDAFVFSKDRAMQLSLLLQSIQDNFKEISEVSIIYTYSNDQFKLGYDKLINTYASNKNLTVTWIKESEFKPQVLAMLKSFSGEYIIGFVDDCVVIRQPNISLLLQAYTDDVTCVSLRMSKQLTYSHSAGIKVTTPSFCEEKDFLKWDWRSSDPRGEWGYPHAVDSHIYKREYFTKIVNTLNFEHPNALEGQMNGKRTSEKPMMVSDLHTCLMTVPNNLTQRGYTPHGTNEEFSLTTLNDKYLKGYKIDTKNFYGHTPTSVHEERDYSLILEDKQ